MTDGYSPEEMRRYWREHSRQWRDLDREKDPEGLTNVCYNGAPLWLNRFASRCQHETVSRMLLKIGPVEGKRVIDIGCGVGRWSRRFSRMGAIVRGIDLQSETLADNRSRFPGCRFFEMSADAIAFADASFDVAISVTVVQHMPSGVQEEALKEIRRVLKPGGWFILLECVSDRGPHMFSRDTSGWIRQAEVSGFRAEFISPYDFAPLIYGLRSLSAGLQPGAGGKGGRLAPVEEYVARFRNAGAARGIARSVYRMVLRAATTASYPLESLLVRAGPASMAHHAGMLFRAV